jgi:hypothetical protein
VTREQTCHKIADHSSDERDELHGWFSVEGPS